MMSLNPLLLVGGVIGTVSVLLLIAYACVKDKKTAMGFERSMADGEILRRLFGYAKPYLKQMCIRDRQWPDCRRLRSGCCACYPVHDAAEPVAERRIPAVLGHLP